MLSETTHSSSKQNLHEIVRLQYSHNLVKLTQKRFWFLNEILVLKRDQQAVNNQIFFPFLLPTYFDKHSLNG